MFRIIPNKLVDLPGLLYHLYYMNREIVYCDRKTVCVIYFLYTVKNHYYM